MNSSSHMLMFPSTFIWITICGVIVIAVLLLIILKLSDSLNAVIDAHNELEADVTDLEAQTDELYSRLHRVEGQLSRQRSVNHAMGK